MNSVRSSPSRLRTALVLLGLCILILALHLAGGLVSADLSFENPVAIVTTVSRWLALMLSYYLAGIVIVTAVLGEQLSETRWGWVVPQAAIGVVAILLGTSAIVVPMTIKVDDNAHDPNAELPDMALVLQELDSPLTLVETTTESTADQPRLVDAAMVDWWVTEAGDSLWSIAQEHLEDELGEHDLSDETVAAYWRILIEANTDRLSDPQNPDLILPGQQFVLPPLQN